MPTRLMPVKHPAGPPLDRPPRARSSRSQLVTLWLMAVTTAALLAAFLVVRLDLVPGTYTAQSYPEVPVPEADPAQPQPETIRPEDWGAVGDGITDDSAALQSAIDAAAGRVLELAPGTTYLSSQALRLPSHSTVRGSESSVLAFTWEHPTDLDAGGSFYLGNKDQIGGNSDIVLEGFSIRGAGDGLPAGPMDETMRNVPAIRLRIVNTFVVRDLDVGFAPGISILYQGSVHGLIENNHVHDSGRDGITGTSLQTVLADITVSGNLIERVGDDGVAVAGATVRESNSKVLPRDIRITDNRIVGWSENPNGKVLGRGIALLAVTYVDVLRNEIARTAGAGILLRGAPDDESINPLTNEPWYSSHVTISGNSIEDAAALGETSILPEEFSGQHGIDIDRAEFVSGQDNEVDAAVGVDVHLGDCRDCNVNLRS